MKAFPRLSRSLGSTAAAATLLSVLRVLAQTPAPASQANTASTDSAIVLSPFTVDAGTDQGYLATQTLNGTRLRTDLKDIGSALTTFTEQLMDDIAATSINDLMSFAPNTDPFIATTADVTGNGNDFINVGNQQYVTRGGATAVVSQDFFGTNVPNDRFNTESLTFTRGPNAILFGLGNASGAFVSSSKRAKFKTATTAAYQVDERGSYRATFDHNHVLKPGLLAVRYSGLYESRNTISYTSPGLVSTQFSAGGVQRHQLPLPRQRLHLSHVRLQFRQHRLSPA